MTPDLFGPEETQESADFERFWIHTPKNRRESKQEARRQWAKLTESQRQAALHDLIDRDRPNQDNSWRQGYNPAPHRYLKHHRWEDEWEAAQHEACQRNRTPSQRTRDAILARRQNGA